MDFGESLYTAAFSGYRSGKFAFSLTAPGARLDSLKARLENAVLEAAVRGYTDFYCGGAQGFDILAGETVLALRRQYSGLRLLCALPCPGHALGKDGWQTRLERLLDEADRVTEVSPIYSRDCFHERNRYMIDRSRLLICYFGGQPGGTAYTVQYALKKGLEVVNVFKTSDATD